VPAGLRGGHVDAAAALAGVGDDGFAVEFVDIDGSLRCEPLSRCVNLRFEEVLPAREFPVFKGQRNFPGRWWSATVGRHVGYESWLERDHVMLLDFDPTVVGIASQPFWLRWPAGDRARRHLPDYFARTADGGAVVVDVRPDDRIRPGDAEAFDATARACQRLGWQFRRVGALEPVFVANLRWLSRYRHPRHGRREDAVAALLSVFAEPVALFNAAARAGERLATLPVLYHLLWRQVLTADLTTTPLGPSTIVRRADRSGR
jgi:hypothetical protein